MDGTVPCRPEAVIREVSASGRTESQRGHSERRTPARSRALRSSEFLPLCDAARTPVRGPAASLSSVWRRHAHCPSLSRPPWWSAFLPISASRPNRHRLSRHAGRRRGTMRSRMPYPTGPPWHSPSPSICSTSRCSGSLSRRPPLRPALKPLRAPHRQRENPRPPQAHRTSGPRIFIPLPLLRPANSLARALLRS
jgi:hypothetical protein